MPARREVAAVAAFLGTAPLALTALAAAPAVAHGSTGRIGDAAVRPAGSVRSTVDLRTGSDT